MELIVLGKYGPYPGPGGATSGYLIKTEKTQLLLDCGSGVLGRLLQYTGVDALDAILLSHLHHDHISDMAVLRYLFQVEASKGLLRHLPKPVFLPKTPEEAHQTLVDNSSLRATAITADFELKLNELSIRFMRTAHPVECYAMRISNGEKTLVYTGDSAWSDALVNFAQGADVILADTCFLDADLKASSPHMSARQAGLLARQAMTSRLLLTHLWRGYAEEAVEREAGAEFAHAQVVKEMTTYVI